MKLFKLLTVLILALLIFGSAGYFGYELFIKPGRAVRREKAVKDAAPAPTATPDPAKPVFDSLKTRQASGITPALRDEWLSFTTTYTNSPLLPEGRRSLGTANMALLFQGQGAGDTNFPVYTVVKGDSLAKIASRQHSSAELIQRANQLPGIGLQIGQQLLIPRLSITMEIDHSAKSLTLLNNGIYLKEYTLMACPPFTKSTPIATKVLDKSALSGAKRLAFGDKAYDAAEKTILIAQTPAIVGAPPAPSPTPATLPGTNAPSSSPVATTPTPASSAPPLPFGFVLQESDLREIFPLIQRNAPVTIR